MLNASQAKELTEDEVQPTSFCLLAIPAFDRRFEVRLKALTDHAKDWCLRNTESYGRYALVCLSVFGAQSGCRKLERCDFC